MDIDIDTDTDIDIDIDLDMWVAINMRFCLYGFVFIRFQSSIIHQRYPTIGHPNASVPVSMMVIPISQLFYHQSTGSTNIYQLYPNGIDGKPCQTL